LPASAGTAGAAAPEIPPAYVDQLADGGKLVIPLGGRNEQVLQLYTKKGDTLEMKDIAPVRFVPLVGKHSWES